MERVWHIWILGLSTHVMLGNLLIFQSFQGFSFIFLHKMLSLGEQISVLLKFWVLI